ncbi:MAG: formate--tetrahydrofolate ligase [Polyangia bacterium]
MRPIKDVAHDLGFTADQIIPWGPHVAKLDASVVFPTVPAARRGKLVLVTAISPTPAGEGKTTTTIGLTQAARKNGVNAVCALREPSLGPIFGVKGGGTGGGQSMVQPSDRINLHLTGDLHAITSAHNLLAAVADVDLYFNQPSRLDGRQMTFRRALDMNDRFLRKMVIGLGGKSMGSPREDGFDITAASEVMAILCLSKDWADLKTRLGNILVGYGRDGSPVFARDLATHGAMAALLRDALLPNLVQTTDGSPALVHGGPFANIAHGCNSIIATRVALERADVVFTEAGFGCDLGAEKFLDIKCRTAGIFPSAVVLVATLRALKYHGGVSAAESGAPNVTALGKGMENLEKHIESVRAFGLEPVVAVNFRTGDPKDELEWVQAHLQTLDVESSVADVYGQGGAGAVELADIVVKKALACDPEPRFMYELSDSPQEKMRKVARTIYGADDVDFASAATASIDRAVKLGFGELPICVAKTHLSLSDDAKKVGRPRGFRMTVREARLSAGAGFLVMLTGEILTMPGLPKVPQATKIDLSADGVISGIV